MVAHRLAHNYYALIIAFMIMGMVHCGSHQLSEEQVAKRPTEDTKDARQRTPSPQEIVRPTRRKICLLASNSAGCIDEHPLGHVGGS